MTTRGQAGAAPSRRVSLLQEILEGDALTDREIEVLHGAALGETAAQTGARVFLATETVREHRKRAVAKLGAPNLLRAVVIAISVGALNLTELVDD